MVAYAVYPHRGRVLPTLTTSVYELRGRTEGLRVSSSRRVRFSGFRWFFLRFCAALLALSKLVLLASAALNNASRPTAFWAALRRRYLFNSSTILTFTRRPGLLLFRFAARKHTCTSLPYGKVSVMSGNDTLTTSINMIAKFTMKY